MVPERVLHLDWLSLISLGCLKIYGGSAYHSRVSINSKDLEMFTNVVTLVILKKLQIVYKLVKKSTFMRSYELPHMLPKAFSGWFPVLKSAQALRPVHARTTLWHPCCEQLHLSSPQPEDTQSYISSSPLERPVESWELLLHPTGLISGQISRTVEGNV